MVGGGEGVIVCQVGSADRAGGVILSGGERWFIQTQMLSRVPAAALNQTLGTVLHMEKIQI